MTLQKRVEILERELRKLRSSLEPSAVAQHGDYGWIDGRPAIIVENGSECGSFLFVNGEYAYHHQDDLVLELIATGNIFDIISECGEHGKIIAFSEQEISNGTALIKAKTLLSKE